MADEESAEWIGEGRISLDRLAELETRRGFVTRPGLGIREVECVVFEGLAVLEGDIILGSASDLAATVGEVSRGAGRVEIHPSSRVLDEAGRFRTEGIGVRDPAFLWPNASIPYAIEANVTASHRVREAIGMWQSQTPVRFSEHQGEKDYVAFCLGGWSSPIGRRGSRQEIKIGAMNSPGKVAHEIGHALGLWHEHTRSDRDEFIQIIWENIRTGTRSFFRKPSTAEAVDLNEYDHDSIMHYSASAFTANGKPTIAAQQSIGQRDHLSEGDIDAVKRLYRDLD